MEALAAAVVMSVLCPAAHTGASVPSCRKQRIELAGALQRMQVVAAADVRFTDENLRHGPAAVRASHHFGAARAFHAHVDLEELDALALQQRFGGAAIAAPGRGIDFHRGHSLICCKVSVIRLLYM